MITVIGLQELMRNVTEIRVMTQNLTFRKTTYVPAVICSQGLELQLCGEGGSLWLPGGHCSIHFTKRNRAAHICLLCSQTILHFLVCPVLFTGEGKAGVRPCLAPRVDINHLFTKLWKRAKSGNRGKVYAEWASARRPPSLTQDFGMYPTERQTKLKHVASVLHHLAINLLSVWIMAKLHAATELLS